MRNGLSFRAAARRVGCTHKAIADAIAAKRIPLQPDGTISPADVDAWNSTRRAKRGGARRRPPPRKADSSRAKVATRAASAGDDADAAPAADSGPRPLAAPAIDLAALARTLAAGGMFGDRASAELARDSYMARLRQLEFQERSAQLLSVEKVAAAISASNAKVRTRFLAMPSELAPTLARCKTATEAQSILHGAIVDALSELCAAFGADCGE